MNDVTQVKLHDFCWVDLCTTDIEKATQFYEAIFGWKPEKSSCPDGGSYTLMHVENHDIAGAYQITEEMKTQGVTPHWGSYVQVEDVDTTVSKAENLGAKCLQKPFDVMDCGRMAVLADPTGAIFSLWQTKQNKGTSLAKNHPGNCGWNELLTTDTNKAGAFYADLFQWKLETKDFNGTAYTSFMNGDQPVGGMMELTKECKDAPPHWGVYFTVSNLDQTLATIKEMGGESHGDPIEIPEVGRFAMMSDPQGVHFSVIQFAK